MKFLVTVKRVHDYESKPKLTPDGKSVVSEGVNMIMNPFDEIAVEEALRHQEKLGGEVVIVSVGPEDATQQIRGALAMGADRGILVKTTENLDSSALSAVLAKIVEQEKPDVIFMGKQAVDDDNRQVAEMLAERLGYGLAPQANTVKLEGTTATVVCEADGGLETITVTLPGIITTDLRLNEPRYAALPGIMKAKKKPLEEKNLADCGVDTAPKMVVVGLELPAKKQGGQKVPDVATLIKKLHEEAKVI